MLPETLSQNIKTTENQSTSSHGLPPEETWVRQGARSERSPRGLSGIALRAHKSSAPTSIWRAVGQYKGIYIWTVFHQVTVPWCRLLSPQNEAPGHTRGEHPGEVSRDCMTKRGKRRSMKAELEVINRHLKMFSLAMSPRNTQENKHTASSFCLVSGHSLWWGWRKGLLLPHKDSLAMCTNSLNMPWHLTM